MKWVCTMQVPGTHQNRKLEPDWHQNVAGQAYNKKRSEISRATLPLGHGIYCITFFFFSSMLNCWSVPTRQPNSRLALHNHNYEETDAKYT